MINKTPKNSATKIMVKEESALLVFLIANLKNKSRNTIKALLRDKQILVEGKPVSQFNHILKPSQSVEIQWEKASKSPQLRGIKIIFEDEHLIVIDKQAGILSIATDKQKDQTAYSMLSAYVKKQNPAHKIFVVHRLDRETSGLMVYAKNEKVKRLLQDSWNETVEARTYLALVEGIVQKPKDTIISYLAENKAFVVYSTKNHAEGQKAITHYEVLNTKPPYSLLKVDLETGRKNQIRVHLKDIGHPIVGDEKYGAKSNPIKRLGLHAWKFSFKHPITHKLLHFETEIPNKFELRGVS